MKKNNLLLLKLTRQRAHLLLGVLVTIFISCGKVVEPKKEFIVSVDNIQLEMVKVNTPTPLHNSGDQPVWMAQSGTAIYFSNPASGAPQFFDKYDLTTNSFTALAPFSTICMCVHESKLVPAGNDLFYIPEGSGMKYDVTSNTFTPTSHSADAAATVGKSGVGYLNGRIYFLGQNSLSKTFMYYDVANDSWGLLPDYFYNTNSSNLLGVNNKLYVFGGVNTSRKVSVYDPATQDWTAKRDANFDMDYSFDRHLTALYNGRFVFVLHASSIHIYDIETDTWSATPRTLQLSSDLRVRNLFSINNKLYLTGINNGNFELYALKIK